MANNENTELEAADLLMNKGIEIKVGRRTYKVKEVSLGMLDAISALRLQMSIDEKALKEDPIAAGNKSVYVNAKLAARVIAIAVLGYGWRGWKRKLFTKYMTKRLYESLTSATLFECAIAVSKLSNIADFTNSIRLMSGIRTTAPNPDPNLVEE